MEKNNPEILNKMSKEQLLDLLGEEKANQIREEFKAGTITIDKLYNLINEASQNQEQTNMIFDALFSKLSKVEIFSLVQDDPQKIEQYRMMDGFKEKISRGTTSLKDLRKLCDIAFGREPDELKEQIIQKFVEVGKVTLDDENESNDVKEVKDKHDDDEIDL